MTNDDTEILYKPPSNGACEDRWRAQNAILLNIFLVTFLVSFLGCFYIVRFQLDVCSLSEEICEAASPYTPEQLHLSLGANDHEYYVTWATMKPIDTFLVYRKLDSRVIQFIKGERSDGHFESDSKRGLSYSKFSYRASMSVNLNTEYVYRVVACVSEFGCDNLSNDGQALLDKAQYSSKEYQFKTRSFSDPYRTLKMIFYGDMGLLNAQSVPRLNTEINQNDLIIHNGDFAYDLNTQNGKYGDRFMRLIEPIAARIPYQTSVGNHEIAANFSEYNHRFTMINRGKINHGAMNNFFYSFNAGPVHFVAISTEFYYFLDRVGLEPLIRQYNWLKEDLEHASSGEERAKRPWIIVFGHRPMYCSSRDGDDCSKDTNILRRGLTNAGGFALEKFFYDFGVDVEMYSHEHQYERFLPIFDGKVYNGSLEDPYHNAKAPTHVISGSAGCQEKLDPFESHTAPGSVVRIVDYGYMRLKASRCKLEFQQISDDLDGTVVDQFVLTKDKLYNYPGQGPQLEGC